MNYGGYGNAYPPTTMYGQQMLTNYPANNYYAGAMNPYAATGAGYYPNQAYMGNQGYYGYGAGGAYGAYGGYGGYGAGGMGYYPYKQSTLRNIFNRIRHGSSYGYGYPNQMLGYNEYGRHRGSWIDYQ